MCSKEVGKQQRCCNCWLGFYSISLSFVSTVKQLSTAAVIDLGSGIVKAGFAGSIAPRCMLPSVIGVPRRFSQDVSKMTRGCFVGEEAISKAGMLQLGKVIIYCRNEFYASDKKDTSR